MMRYAGIIENDTAAAPGLCFSFYVQGCPIHCEGCQNPQTWSEDGGYEFTNQTLDRIIEGIRANNFTRSFAILGGEPLSPRNIFLTAMVLSEVRKVYPDITIWIWSGYEIEDLINTENVHLQNIMTSINGLVCGPFEKDKRDISLPFRGSTNQRVFLFDAEKKLWYNKENNEERYKING